MAEVRISPDRLFAELPQSTLERKLIAEYLLGKGHNIRDLGNMPELTAKSLMKDACLYAALKLTEIESRAKFCREIER